MSTSQAAVIERGQYGVRAHAVVWLRALRAESFPVSIVPALLGIAAAHVQGYRIDLLLAMMTIAGALCIHAATNLLQDYFDYKSGLDREGTLGGSGVLVSGRCSARAILIASIAFFALSAGAVGYLIVMSGIALAWIAGAGLMLGAGYAIPKYGLKYHLLGDIGVFLAFGIGMTLGAYFVQTQRIDWYPLVYAVPFGLLVAALLHANNMRDALDDAQVGLRNTAFRLGLRASCLYYAVLVTGAYALTAAGVFVRLMPRGSVFVLVTFPLALHLMRSVWRSSFESREALAKGVIGTAMLSLFFGLALILGIAKG
jgi:1,4-dihydroxy-2-naphthoate octaprenyltransferase